MTVAEYIRKSLIASYIGNIVGALLLAIPYTYFYLSDYIPDTSNLRGVEEGETINEVGLVRADTPSLSKRDQ